MWHDSPEVDPLGTLQVASGDGDGAQGFGQLRLNFEALRKRKALPSRNGGAYRLLKQRKYVAKDE